MATNNQRDVQQLFVGGVASKSTSGPDSLNDGEIGLFTPAGTRLTEANAATEDEFIIVQGRGSDVDVLSGIIKKADITKASRLVYTAATEQLDYIGYNGTSGSIDVVNNNDYLVRIQLAQHLTSNHGGLYIKHGFYRSDSTATEEEIAQGLVQSINDDFRKEPDIIVRCERVNSDAGTGTTGATGTLTVTKRSKYVDASVSATAEYNAGDYVRFGTATTDPVYKIVSFPNATTMELDTPYQGDSATFTAGNAEIVTEANAQAGDFGLKLEGQELKFTRGKLHYAKASWKLGIENFGTTTITNDTDATKGSGTTNQLHELEYFVQGNEGEFFRMGEPNIFPQREEVTDALGYDLIHLTTLENYSDSIVMGPIRKQFTLAVPNNGGTVPDYANTATSDDITDVLEVLVYGSTGGQLAL